MSVEIVSNGLLKYIVEDGKARICSYRGFKKFFTIPKTLEGYTVTSMGGGSFFDCKKLIKVIIPDSITSINEMAFWGCKNLQSIEIPNSVTSIAKEAFVKCPRLTEIKLREDHPVYTFYDGALFEKATGLLHSYIDIKGSTFYTVPNFVTSIGESAFNGCDNLTRVEISDSVTSIGKEAFYGCANLSSVKLGNSIVIIEVWAFSGCKSLVEVTVPKSVTSIEGNAFKHCSSLKEVTVPKSVISIGTGAFDLGVTIVGVEGSFACEYAFAEGLEFREG